MWEWEGGGNISRQSWVLMLVYIQVKYISLQSEPEV